MTQQQYMTALAKATEVRRARAEVRRDVSEGRLLLTDALVDPRAGGMTVFQLLSSQHGWGRRTSMRVLNRLRIGEQKQVGMLTDRQRGLLVAECEPKREAA